MTTLSLTINGSPYTYTSTPDQDAGLGAARSAAMAALTPQIDPTSGTKDANGVLIPDTQTNLPVTSLPGYIATDALYLQAVVQGWATANANTRFPVTAIDGTVTTHALGAQDINDCIARAMASYAGAPPPAPSAPVPLSPQAVAASLLVYVSDKAAACSVGNLTVTSVPLVTGPPAIYPSADISTQGQVDILGLIADATLNGSTLWYQSNLPGGQISVTLAQVQAIGEAIKAVRVKNVAAEVSAGVGLAAGAITTETQIDALAWPATS